MIYSVWNQSAGVWDYYETYERRMKANEPSPKHLRPAHKLGMTPQEASWPLPIEARPVGSGPYPKGRIAHPTGGQLSGFLGFDTQLLRWAALGAAGFFLWRKLK